MSKPSPAHLCGWFMDVCGRLVKCARVRSDLANDRFESKADLRPRRRYVRFTLNELTSQLDAKLSATWTRLLSAVTDFSDGL